MKHLTDGIMLPFPDDDRTGGLILGVSRRLLLDHRTGEDTLRMSSGSA